MKKNILIIVVLSLFIGGWGIFSWWQVQIPPGNFGIIKTKTSGILPVVLKTGVTFFSWELLLPTNSVVFLFPEYVLNEEFNLEGSLPSGVLYSDFIGEENIFSYHAQGTIQGEVDEENVRNLVKENLVAPDTYQKFLSISKADIKRNIAGFLESQTTNSLIGQLSGEKLPPILPWKNLVITFQKLILPDRNLYNQIQEQYLTIQKNIFSDRSSIIINSKYYEHKEESKIVLLKKYGELIKEYPQLLDFWKLASDVPEIRKMLPGVQ